MANLQRLRVLSLTTGGQLVTLANPLSVSTQGASDTIYLSGPLEYADGSTLTITSGTNYLPVVVEPDTQRAEEIWITANPTGSSTVSAACLRGMGSSTGAPGHSAGSTTFVVSGPMPTDFPDPNGPPYAIYQFGTSWTYSSMNPAGIFTNGTSTSNGTAFQLTIPVQLQATDYLVKWKCWGSGANYSWQVWKDGANVLPFGSPYADFAPYAQATSGHNQPYVTDFCWVVSIPADGNTHTIGIFVEADDSTAGVTFYAAWLTAQRAAAGL